MASDLVLYANGQEGDAALATSELLIWLNVHEAKHDERHPHHAYVASLDHTPPSVECWPQSAVAALESQGASNLATVARDSCARVGLQAGLVARFCAECRDTGFLASASARQDCARQADTLDEDKEEESREQCWLDLLDCWRRWMLRLFCGPKATISQGDIQDDFFQMKIQMKIPAQRW
jgi:hypothetical protein